MMRVRIAIAVFIGLTIGGLDARAQEPDRLARAVEDLVRVQILGIRTNWSLQRLRELERDAANTVELVTQLTSQDLTPEDLALLEQQNPERAARERGSSLRRRSELNMAQRRVEQIEREAAAIRKDIAASLEMLAAIERRMMTSTGPES